MPTPLGKDIDLQMMVDSVHAGDKQIQQSQTGFLIFCNIALINWVSKKQPTIETSVFGAEFVAMKHGVCVVFPPVTSAVFPYSELPQLGNVHPMTSYAGTLGAFGSTNPVFWEFLRSPIHSIRLRDTGLLGLLTT